MSGLRTVLPQACLPSASFVAASAAKPPRQHQLDDMRPSLPAEVHTAAQSSRHQTLREQASSTNMLQDPTQGRGIRTCPRNKRGRSRCCS